MAKVDWDANENETSSGFEPIPKGRYLARVESCESKDTKSGSGSYLEFALVVEKGEFTKRKLWARLNVHNSSETAQRIGREQFNALCVACGFKVGEVKDTTKLVGKRMIALVDIEKGDRGDMNRVVGFMAPTSAAGGAAPEPETPAGKGGEGKTKTPSRPIDDDIPF